MPSQFFGLNIAYSGLTASNVGLNTTGNNISNVETRGYSRQQVNQRASNALRTFTTYGCAGAGVDTIAIERMRDEFYDVKYWNNNKSTGEYDKKQYYMKQIEDYFADNGKTIKGFNTIFEDMYLALAEVKKYAGDPSKKTQFISSAQALADYFNGTAANLQKAQQDANSEIKIKTDQINSLGEEIATLNKQINVIEMQGGTANELRDRRTVLLDKLSTIVDVETQEIPIADASNPDRMTGGNRYIVTIAGGQTLVDMDDFKSLACIPRKPNEKVNQTDIDGLYDIKWKDGSSFGMHSSALGGELKGLLDMRDGNNGVHFKGTVGAVGEIAVPDPDAGKKTVRIDVTAEDLKDLDKCNLSDTGGMINIGGQLFQYDSWSYTADSTAVPPTYSYNFVLSADNTSDISASKVGREANIGDSIDYQGIPYYMQQMNEWVRNFSAEVNKILTQPGAVSDGGDPGEKLFTGNLTNGNQLGFPNTVPYNRDGTVKSTDDSYYRLTASNFSITKILSEHPEKLATHTGGEDEESKYDVLDDLVDLKTNKNKMNFRGDSAGGFLEAIWTDTGLNAQHANMFYSNSNNISKTINTQRLSISGVDKDEEAVNLVKYQNSYTLASKMIQVLTEIYDRLILQTGV